MTFDTSDEELVGIRLRVLNEVWWGLLSRDSDEWDTLVGRLEPDNLGTLDRTSGFITAIALSLPAFSLLLLLGGRRRRAQQPKGAREELPWHAFDNSDDMAGELGLDFVGHPNNKVIELDCSSEGGVTHSSSSNNIKP